MGMLKHRNRIQVRGAITIRGSDSVNPSILGFINQGGTLAITNSQGTGRAGTVGLLDLNDARLRLPMQGTTLGTNSGGIGLAAGIGGSAGGVKLGYSATQAMIGVNINGTVFQLAWAQGGGSVHVTANPAGA